MTKSKKAVFSGSFDPFHEGHLEILRKANDLFDEVYVVVSINPNKNSSDIKLRVNQTKEFLVKNNVNNQVIENNGLTVAIARKLSCNYLVRGVRDLVDLEYELELQKQNKLIDSEIETVILFADGKFSNLRSSNFKK